ncbi:MAG: DUF4340 domain-containing protein [Gammaproteobacteria bacterium]|nr:DUF4340 domain-containing protein [Gammaproteobacteria bacterium]
MNRAITLLMIVLIVQVIAAVTLTQSQQHFDTFEANQPLLSATISDADTLRISVADEDTEAAQTEFVLNKNNGSWQIANRDGFPADNAQVQRLIEKLIHLKKSWPVATSAAAAKRFKTDAGNYQKKIVLARGEQTLATLYIGTSPGFKKVHARVEGDSNIYAIEFSTYEASNKANRWLDRSQLTINRDEISQVELPTFTLKRVSDEDENALTISDLKENESIESAQLEQLQQLLSQLAKINFTDVIGKKIANVAVGEPAFGYTVHLKSGQQIRYDFFSISGKKDYQLITSADDYLFTVDAGTVEKLQQSSRDTFISTKIAPVTATNVEQPDTGQTSALMAPENSADIPPSDADSDAGLERQTTKPGNP